ncbi:MAG: hypothetical protein RLZZ450_2445 [Pseudomonadota bacterium]|jgi:long-chain acyl-CoA synthetase
MSIAEAHRRLTAPGARFEMEVVTIRGVPTRVWKNAPPTVRDVFLNACAFEARECLVYEGERATYGAFSRAVRVLAASFREHGLAKGDRVALVMRNLPEWPVAFFAASLCGAIVTPINAWGTGPELSYALSDSGAKMAVIDGERLERLLPHLPECPALERVYLTRGTRAGDPRIVRLDAVIGAVADWAALPDLQLPDVPLAPDDDATIFFTSGTTGRPKGALSSHRAVCSNTFTSACAHARSFLRRGEDPPVLDPNAPQRVSLLVVPLFHVTGCMPWLLGGMNGGGKIVLMRKWNVEQALSLIAEERVTLAGGVPTIAWQLLEHPARREHDLSSLEAVNYGGAPAAPELVRRLKAVFPKAQPANGWGMTEVTSSFASNNAEDYLRRPDSCGLAAPTNDWKIMSPDGTRELPVGDVGELWVKGPQVITGYWNRPEATAETLVDGWLKTGDIARLDEEGFCYLVDRAKDMLIRGGENIYCVEVENALHEHPSVLDAAVVGLSHPTLGEEPAAVVQVKAGHAVTEEALRAFVAARLAAFKVPVRVLFWSDILPRNPAGKILKAELRKLFD